MKSLEQLLRRRGALPTLARWVSAATDRVVWLPGDPQSGASTLLAIQVSTRTVLGALAFHAGGILVDGSWLRILGCGHDQLRWGLAEWNGLMMQANPQRLLLAHDAVGGFFALERNKRVSYCSPDTLEWRDTRLAHADWLEWALSSDLSDFYELLRWPGWREEVARLESSHCFVTQPPLHQPGPPLRDRPRTAVPVRDVWSTLRLREG